MEGRKNNRLNNVLPIYFLPVEEILWAFIKTNLDFADQENVVARDSILEVNLKAIQETGLS